MRETRGGGSGKRLQDLMGWWWPAGLGLHAACGRRPLFVKLKKKKKVDHDTTASNESKDDAMAMLMMKLSSSILYLPLWSLSHGVDTYTPFQITSRFNFFGTSILLYI